MEDLERERKIQLECVFCSSTGFDLPQEGYQPEDGEMIKCSNCGRLNDFESIQEVAIAKGREEIEAEFTEYTQKELMKMFKKAGFTVK